VNLKRNEKDTPDVNLTPLIDVVFLLLIFFMVSTEFKDRSALKFDLPQASPAPKKLETKKALTIFILPDGKIKLERKITGSKGKTDSKTFSLTSGNLKSLTRAIRKVTKGDKKTRIYIEGAENSPFKSFVKVTDALQSIGLTKISIVTRQIRSK